MADTIEVYFDKYGEKISYTRMMELALDTDYTRIKASQIAHVDGNEDITVSTVWLWSGVQATTPLFETMIFGGPEDGWRKQYTNLEEAKLGHDFAIHLCTGMRAQDKWSS